MLNSVTLIGNLGRDAELRYTPSGVAVANLSVATSERWKDKESGEARERTEWHRIVAWSKLAEIAGELYTKGKQILVEGTLQTRKWTDDNDIVRYTTEIRATRLRLLGPAPAGAGQNAPVPSDADAPPAVAAAAAQSTEQPAPVRVEDDIPF